MASTFPPDHQVQLKPRKGHDINWSCDMHGETIRFYCKKHDIPICHRCATKDHGQKPCELDDIEDVILDRMERLDDKRQEIQEMKKQIQTLDSKMESIATFSSDHLQTVYDEVNSTHKDMSKSVNDDDEKKSRLVNEEAEEEICIINQKRDGQIKACNAEIEKQQLIINESQAKLMSEIKAISEVISKKINDLKNTIQHAISTLDNIHAKIKMIMQNDKTLVSEELQVLASLDDNLNVNVHRDVSDCLDRMQREILKVKFVEGDVGGEHSRRIVGYIGKWELVKSIHTLSKPILCGLISDDEICVWDEVDNATYMHVTNISTEHTQKVIEGDGSMSIVSCALIDSNVIVCGKLARRGLTGDSLDGCITLYDRQWKVNRDISIPRNNSFDTSVYVDVDRDGMILAAQNFQSNIYVINPADGRIISTITMQGKVVRGKIQALSSGDIVVKTGYNKFTVISRSGEEKAAIHSDEWCAPECRVDKLTDTLYITYCNKECNISAVDHVSCDGVIQSKRIVEYEESGGMNPCLVAPSGNLVACNGNNFGVYKKSFIV